MRIDLASLQRASLWGYAISVLLALLAGMLAQGLAVWFGVTQLSFVFMTSVLLAGAFFGARPAMLAAAVAFVLYNFFLVDPRFSLRLASADDFTTLILFFFAAIVTGGLAGRMRDQSLISARRLRITQTLFEASSRIANSIEQQIILQTIADSATVALSTPVFALARRASKWEVAARAPQSFTPSEIDIAAAIEATTAPTAEGPLSPAALIEGRKGPLGVLAIGTANKVRDEERALASFANLAAVALERLELINAMAESQGLAESERLRAALLSSLSHDFRTPLAAILASSTTLETYGDLSDDARRELLASIRMETEHMTRFVANLLDITRLEAGALRPRLCSVDLADVATDAAGHASRMARAKGVEIIVAEGSADALIDPVLIERALINILENAIGFSETGQAIEIRVTCRGEEGVVAISDSGPGIPKAALAHVFDKFYRVADQAPQRRGVGLGLSIAKGFIEAMDGAITATSPINGRGGARFEITVPLATASMSHAK